VAAKKKKGSSPAQKGKDVDKIALKDLSPKKDPRGGVMSTRIHIGGPRSIT
jgi:hypothetical protein